MDESGQEKAGEATSGVKRQYMGCAGGSANGVNTVYCSYATPGGHALVGARIGCPKTNWHGRVTDGCQATPRRAGDAERALAFTDSYVPQADGSVAAGGGEQGAVRRKAHRSPQLWRPVRMALRVPSGRCQRRTARSSLVVASSVPSGDICEAIAFRRIRRWLVGCCPVRTRRLRRVRGPPGAS